MGEITIKVKLNSENILQQWEKTKEKAKELNIEMIKLGEIISKTCEIYGEKPEG